MKKPTEFLCKECLAKMRDYDAQRRKQWRRLNIKVAAPSVTGKILINKIKK